LRGPRHPPRATARNPLEADGPGGGRDSGCGQAAAADGCPAATTSNETTDFQESTMTHAPLARGIRLALLGAGLGATALAGAQDEATELDRIEVTGSRIKRVDIEGPTPITVIDREDLELTGDLSVADVLRASTFNTLGSIREASGNTAQSQATISLRGVGSQRTPRQEDLQRSRTFARAGRRGQGRQAAGHRGRGSGRRSAGDPGGQHHPRHRQGGRREGAGLR